MVTCKVSDPTRITNHIQSYNQTMLFEIGLAVALVYAYRRMQVAKLYPLLTDPVNPNANDHPVLLEAGDSVQHQPVNDELQAHMDMLYELANPLNVHRSIGVPTQHVEVDFHGEVRKAQNIMKTDPMTLMHPLYTSYA